MVLIIIVTVLLLIKNIFYAYCLIRCKFNQNNVFIKVFILGGNELLEYKKMPDFKDKKVAVIGGGNVAMDTSRTIKKMGAKDVYVIYRRAEEQMPSERKEIE